MNPPPPPLSLLALLLLPPWGCSVKEVPAGSRVIDRVDIIGAERADGRELKKRIATSKTEHALGGLFKAVPTLTVIDAFTVEYHVFDRLVLARDLQRIRRWYRARGFYDAEVGAGRVVETEKGHVRVEIVVREGEPVLLGSVELDFPDWERALRANAALVDVVDDYRKNPTEGAEPLPRFDEDRFDEVKDRLKRALTDNGHAYGTVSAKAKVDLAKRRARIRFKASAGPFCKFGPIRFEGLGELPESPLRGALGFKEGEPYSTEKLEGAQYALADFQVFGSVDLVPELSSGGKRQDPVVPITVRVQPIKLRGIKGGIGSEIGSRIDVHGVAGWEDRNFLGGLRRLSIEGRPGLVFFPLAAESLFSPPSDIIVLPEAALRLDFKQPAFPEARTNTLLSAGGRIYRPRTLADPEDFDSNDDYVVGYRELDGALGLERKFRIPYLGGFVFRGAPFIKVQLDDPFSYTDPVDKEDELPPGFQTVLIPYFETTASIDFRKNKEGKPDPVNTHKGVFFGINAQVAALGDAEDVRVRPELRLYAPVFDKLIIAVRWTTGLLIPRNYGFVMTSRKQTREEQCELLDPLNPFVRAQQLAADEQRNFDLQLMGFRGFFSGGPSSNRGYGYRDVGPHQLQPFVVDSCEGLGAGGLLPGDEWLPTGGMGMWELSGELRFPLSEKLIGVLFVDSSDVVETLSDWRVTHPHISPGIGMRFVSPVGRVRFDLGFRPPYLQRVGERYLEPEEGGPAEGESDGVPLSFSVAIGEAF